MRFRSLQRLDIHSYARLEKFLQLKPQTRTLRSPWQVRSLTWRAVILPNSMHHDGSILSMHAGRWSSNLSDFILGAFSDREADASNSTNATSHGNSAHKYLTRLWDIYNTLPIRRTSLISNWRFGLGCCSHIPCRSCVRRELCIGISCIPARTTDCTLACSSELARRLSHSVSTSPGSKRAGSLLLKPWCIVCTFPSKYSGHALQLTARSCARYSEHYPDQPALLS